MRTGFVRIVLVLIGGLICFGGSASAQLGLPQVQVPSLPPNLPGLPPLRVDPLIATGTSLAQVRLDRLADFVRDNRDQVDLDREDQPAVRGVLIATGVDAAMIAAAAKAGFVLTGREQIDGLDLEIARFAVPVGRSLAKAERQLEKLLPMAQVDADNLYFASGPSGAMPGAALATSAAVGSVSLGLIDGGVAAHPSLAGRVEQRGFAAGAPSASRHGTAVASALVGRGAVRGANPGAHLLAADVYGSDAAGGNASAIVKALGWLAERRVAVVTISLIGPDNMLLRIAIARAQGKGMIIVAAVGNDGPAAPPAFPASYRGVLAVTGVDTRNRALPEAGRALHVDFAAPGDGFALATGISSTARLRGTSFAAPLVAGRLSQLYAAPQIAAIEPAVRALIGEARDLGNRGRDPVYGYGLICDACVTR